MNPEYLRECARLITELGDDIIAKQARDLGRINAHDDGYLDGLNDAAQLLRQFAAQDEQNSRAAA